MDGGGLSPNRLRLAIRLVFVLLIGNNVIKDDNCFIYRPLSEDLRMP